jgi:hypothetical protein
MLRSTAFLALSEFECVQVQDPREQLGLHMGGLPVTA